MLEIRIPKEIKEYKEKYFFDLTLRQSIGLGVALALGIPTAIWGKNYVNEDVLGWVVLAVGAIPIAFGFIKYHDMTFEQLAMTWFRMNWETQKRKFEDLPIFWHMREDLIKEDLILQQADRERERIKSAEERKRVKYAERRKGNNRQS